MSVTASLLSARRTTVDDFSMPFDAGVPPVIVGVKIV